MSFVHTNPVQQHKMTE